MGATVSAIRAVAPRLAPSERRVAEVCVERPREVAWWSAADVAEQAGTSTATVIRACQNLGFKGFQHLRMLLLRDLGAVGASAADADSGERSGAGLLRTVFTELATELGGALAPLDEDAFERAVQALATAERVLVVGNGGSGPSAAAVAVRFLANGRPAEAPSDAVIQQLTAAQLTSRDVLLAVSDSGLNSVTLRPAEAARGAGATVIGVTSYAKSTLVELSDIGLVVGGGSGPWGGLGASATVVQVAFLIGLQVAVCQRRGGSAEAAAAAFKHTVPLIDS
ncbi:MurR/RpiR family transcriptional regulator [Rhodococcus sp. T2V]|nr:MurR/RpiR family transcriptional regulator [Rhodococcus sp. T2V]